METESIISSSYPLESHPGRLLTQHLKSVGEAARNKMLDVRGFVPHASEFETLAWITGISHDVGKSSIYFQDYLRSVRPSSLFLKSHSTASSLYSFVVSMRKLNDVESSILAMMMVQGHHGRIQSPGEAVKRVFAHRFELKQQLTNVPRIADLERFLQELDLPEYGSTINSINRHTLLDCLGHAERWRTEHSLSRYFATNLVFSTLIDADRMDAAGVAPPSRASIEVSKVVAHCQGIERREATAPHADKSVLQMRRHVREKVMSSLDTETRIFTLTAPTGSGKTLTSFLFASSLRERLEKSDGFKRRIIYVAPFLGIIDQNEQVIRKALGVRQLHQSPLVLTHHHLSGLRYESPEDETYSNSQAELLIEGWNAEVIITTFVQLLESMIGARAAVLRKLHNIAGSIIILDEVQSVDHEHWLLIHDCIEFLANNFDIRFVLMTATQPLLFSHREVKELFDREYAAPERVTVKTNLDGLAIDGFVAEVNSLLESHNDSSFLIMMNTIGSAIRVFNDIKVTDGVFFLSAGITPKQRKSIIRRVSSRLKRGTRTILVSTQVVEAGVDFDFDVVVRDLAPMDAIVQSAGRCNRNGRRRRDESPVYVYAVHDGNSKYFGNMIYGNELINKTREVLQNCNGSVAHMAKQYYQKVLESRHTQASTEFLQAMYSLDYEKITKFKVIPDEPTTSVFVEIDDDAQRLWLEYVEASTSDWNNPRRKRKSALRRFFLAKRERFYSYVVNYREDDPVLRDIPSQYGFHHISLSKVGDYYSVTGLKQAANVL